MDICFYFLNILLDFLFYPRIIMDITERKMVPGTKFTI